MVSEKRRRGKKITSATQLLHREPYRAIIEVIYHLKEAEPQQIMCVINDKDEEDLYVKRICDKFNKARGEHINNKKTYKRKTATVKRLIQSRPDKPRFNLSSTNLRDYLNTLMQWGVVKKIGRANYQIEPSFINEISRDLNKRILYYYPRSNISDYSDSNVIIYGFESLRRQLEKVSPDMLSDVLLPDPLMLSIDNEFEDDLNKGVIPEELRNKVKANKMINPRRIIEWKEKENYILKHLSKKWLSRILALTDNATITTRKDNEWIIEDGVSFVVRKESDKLNVYAGLLLHWEENPIPNHPTPIRDLRLFSTDTKFVDDLNKKIIPKELKEEFEQYFKREYEDQPFSNNAAVTKGEGKEWIIDDEGAKYLIRKEGDKLKIYPSSRLKWETGKDHITRIKNKIDEIIEKFKELDHEFREAMSYLSLIDAHYLEKYGKPFRDLWDETTLPTPISLFHSHYLFSVSPDLAMSQSRWYKIMREGTLGEEERKKIAKQLYQTHGMKILSALIGIPGFFDFVSYVHEDVEEEYRKKLPKKNTFWDASIKD